MTSAETTTEQRPPTPSGWRLEGATRTEPVPRLVALRRALHARPELGFTEIETAATVIRTLAPVADTVTFGSAAMRHEEPAAMPGADEFERARRRALDHGVPRELVDSLDGGHTGVVVIVKGHRPGPVTAMRFDMDGLPLQEASTISHLPFRAGFASTYDGIMHACGHDGHVAVGIELALRMAANRDFPGEARLLFQPAEEGVRGALTMLAADVTGGVQRVIGLHFGLGLPVGTVAASVTGVMATEKWRVTLNGEPAHASLAPQNGRHAVLGAAVATLGLHTLPQIAGAASRVNVGALHGGTVPNIVPDRAELLVELRADSATAFEQLRDRGRAVIAGAADSYGLRWTIETNGRAATVSCDPVEIDALLQAATHVAGISSALPSAPMPASDDVTLIMQDVQRRGGTATLALVGASSPAPHHHPLFDIDERCLSVAVDWLEAALRRAEERASDGA